MAVRERKGFAGLSMTVPPTIYQIPREKEDGQEVNGDSVVDTALEQ